MSRDTQHSITTPTNLASLVRGLYGRVARRVGVDPSYVSRVARGERQSETIEAALELEMKKIMKIAAKGLSGAKRNHNHNHNHKK